jgi:hypothetical protein
MTECIPYLVKAGIEVSDAYALRRIAMTLRVGMSLNAAATAAQSSETKQPAKFCWYDSNTGRRCHTPTGRRQR